MKRARAVGLARAADAVDDVEEACVEVLKCSGPSGDAAMLGR